MVLCLRLWDRLGLSVGGHDGELRKLLEAGLGLVDNRLPDVVTDAVNLASNLVCGAGLGSLCSEC